ncbi:MAG: hypothetical protein ACLTW0_01990 [Alistipes ihumii]|jgi:hypothetical protein
MEIITKRPKGMPYRKYVEMRKASNNQIRRYLRFGRLYYLSAEIVTVETSLGKSQYRKSYPPFVGSVRRDLRKPI